MKQKQTENQLFCYKAKLKQNSLSKQSMLLQTFWVQIRLTYKENRKWTYDESNKSLTLRYLSKHVFLKAKTNYPLYL